MDDELDVNDACCKFIDWSDGYNVLRFFQFTLFCTGLCREYCCGMTLYGCELWRIDDSVVNSFYRAILNAGRS